MFRHTMATMMLENGADLRFIQLILGHATIKATEVYTQVGIRKLKEIHSATHPGAKLEGAARTSPPASDGDTAARAEILSALEAEAKEEDGEEPSAHEP
jgi:integrase/recombinase XerD